MKHESVLGLSMIKNDELVVWINVLSNDQVDQDGEVYPAIAEPEQLMNELNMINDLLKLQKLKALLNKKRGLKDVISGRIAMELTPKNQKL
ncbi:MAG TPA: hypothetical protein DCR40_10105 [Prolixibacteraceae bacterium]|uniref:Uncharacterized protein n=1 Tax=candidate division WS6 bacterium GW2011_GWF1_36_8 TaxID=1619098 RepID=A0A0G0FBM6_9BACT|nr:MAG: hypothetical protein US29_C0045G0004 [candidate division WS6 bacterium GW2011_GWF1_36_8]KKQ19333.1 MAG: hypothetical protein US34_C0023G0007 [Candidatus Nomurabacteria bacterium GW2011_GWC2_36_9]HAQ19567.1 hypothetical protein [Prolixibacteraceae bacterium]